MESSVQAPAPPDQGESAAISPLPAPGEELARRIAAALRAGRPGCWLGSIPGSKVPLGIPRATAIRFNSGRRHDVFPPREHWDAILRPRLALALATEHPLAFEALTDTDRAEGTRLYATALHDLFGFDDHAVAAACQWAGDHADRTARDALTRGRKQLRRMGAWPWWYFDPTGRPTPGWWRQSAEPRIALAFKTWETGRL